MRFGRLKAALMALVLAAFSSQADAQNWAAFPDGIGSAQTGVSFIDSALPMTQLRFRYDVGQNLRRPNRAEFFWPRNGPANRPFPERSVDYLELNTYVEIACEERLSAFFETPFRWVDPVRNDNTSGVGDLNAGLKLTLFQTECGIVSGQVRCYIPTGDGENGLGTDHVSIEPALLWNQQLCPWLTLEAEARYWVPIRGTDFSGDMLRFGTGLVLGCQTDCLWITPVAEVVAWVPLGGQESFLNENSNVVGFGSARGQNVVNTFLGARAGLHDRIDFYGGYGFSLTSTSWAEEIWRAELRLKF